VASSEPTTDRPARRAPFTWLGARGRGGSVVLVGALFAGVLIASIGAGYSATQAVLDDAKANVAKGNGVAEINAETARTEAEARALAKGRQPLEVVTLKDGRVATVNHDTNEVIVTAGPGLQDPETTVPGGRPGSRSDEDQYLMVAGADAGYLVDPADDTVTMLSRDRPGTGVRVDGATREAVADGTEGIWIRTADYKAVHVVRDGIEDERGSADNLTVADGDPIALTTDGKAIDLGADHVIAESVPHGPAVVVGSSKGAGRYLLLLDRAAKKLTVVDPRTDSPVRDFDVPDALHELHDPVALGDRVYVADYTTHELLVFDLRTGERAEPSHVPGKSKTFALEIHGQRVWANDQFDRRALVFNRKGQDRLVDKGAGKLTDTDGPPATNDKDRDKPRGRQPQQDVPDDDSAGQPPTGTPRRSGPRQDESKVRRVAVPFIEAGTPQDEACDRIRAAKLVCDLVEIGTDGGSTGTVKDTDPPGGYRLPENTAVHVHVYGRITVPDVVNLPVGRACELIENGGENGPGLTCESEESPDPGSTFSDLDTVAEQDPRAGTPVSSGSAVTVRYRNQVRMPDLKNTVGSDQCTAITSATDNKVGCTIVQGPEAPNPNLAGTVQSQTPSAGALVGAGGTVQLTIYATPVPKVPPIPAGTEINQACQMVQSAGYACDARADELARHFNQVTRQEPAPGTPQAGGSVILHYSNVEPEPVYRWNANNGDQVSILRLESSQGDPNYTKEPNPIGYAYGGTAGIPGTTVVNGFFCAISANRCGGYVRNHYISRDANPKQDYTGPTPLASFIWPPEQCPQGTILISRYLIRPNGKDQYTFGNTPPAGWTPDDFQEPLGCIWSP
jgi:beta-lactam-binding protein with PASTA domain